MSATATSTPLRRSARLAGKTAPPVTDTPPIKVTEPVTITKTEPASILLPCDRCGLHHILDEEDEEVKKILAVTAATKRFNTTVRPLMVAIEENPVETAIILALTAIYEHPDAPVALKEPLSLTAFIKKTVRGYLSHPTPSIRLLAKAIRDKYF